MKYCDESQPRGRWGWKADNASPVKICVYLRFQFLQRSCYGFAGGAGSLTISCRWSM